MLFQLNCLMSDHRTSVPVVVLLLSGGGADNFEQALAESSLLKGANVSILVAVVGNAFVHPGFHLLASYPFDRNFFQTSNLQSLRASLVVKICNSRTDLYAPDDIPMTQQLLIKLRKNDPVPRLLL